MRVLGWEIRRVPKRVTLDEWYQHALSNPRPLVGSPEEYMEKFGTCALCAAVSLPLEHYATRQHQLGEAL